MNRENYIARVISHYENKWGKNYSVKEWLEGPTHRHPPDLKILEYSSGIAHKAWTYATVGMSCEKHKTAIELHMLSPYKSDRIVELLTILATYHYNDAELGLYHRLNFGVPWLEQSKCSKVFISLPYLDGPDLETLCDGDLHIQFLWAIPTTPEEAAYLDEHTVEELEQKFEENQLNCIDINRSSVV